MVTQDKLGPDRSVAGLRPKEHLALRWTASEPGAFQFPFLDLNRASNWTEFRAALSRLQGPGSNFVYADVDGNIGYQAAGRLPIRKGWSGDLPVDGASGRYEWQGYIPFEDLPSSFNPPAGMIVTANQNPFPADYPYPVSGGFASHYRSAQIRALLGSRRGWQPSGLISIQKDVYSAFSHFLARQIAAACERRKVSNPALAGALAALRGWNGQMEKDLPQPLLVTLAYQRLRRALGDSAAPGKGLLYDVQMAPAVVERLLRERPAGWVKDWDELLVRSLDEAVEEGSRSQGPNVERWIYGKYTEITITHPIGNTLPYFKKYFNIGPFELSGSATTVKQISRRLGPSMRMAVDLGDWERSLLNLPAGESGQVLSPHYRDQWGHYYNGLSFPMPFDKVEAKSVLELIP
jgi:penicillin amidase